MKKDSSCMAAVLLMPSGSETVSGNYASSRAFTTELQSFLMKDLYDYLPLTGTIMVLDYWHESNVLHIDPAGVIVELNTLSLYGNLPDWLNLITAIVNFLLMYLYADIVNRFSIYKKIPR